MIRVSRRGFFGVIAGALTAAALPWAPAAPVPPALTFKGAPFVFDANCPASGAVGGLNRASFKFWRNTPEGAAERERALARDRAFELSRGAMR